MSILDTLANFFHLPGGPSDEEKKKQTSQPAPQPNSLMSTLSSSLKETSNMAKFLPAAQVSTKSVVPEEVKKNEVKKTNSEVAQQIAQSFVTRPLLSAAATINSAITSATGGTPKNTITPTKLTAPIFGSEPVHTAQYSYEESLSKAKSQGVSKYAAAPLAFLGSLGELAGNLTPVIFPEGKLTETSKILGATNDARFIRSHLDDMKFSPEIIDKNISALKEADAVKAKSILQSMTKEQNALAEAQRVESATIPKKEAASDKQTLYHGTNEDFGEFSNTKQTSGKYPGVYLAEDKNIAQSFGSNVKEIPVEGKFFDLSDPAIEKRMVEEAGGETQLANKLKGEGYVGAKIGNEHVVFDAADANKGMGAKSIASIIDENPNLKESQSARTVKESNLMHEDIAKDIDMHYTPRAQAGVIESAEKRVASDLEEARKFAMENSSDEAQAVTKLILQKDNEAYQLLKKTDPEAARVLGERNLKFIQDNAVSRLGTEQARSLAIRRTLYSEKTGEGVIQDLSKKIEGYNVEHPNKKVPKLTVDDYDKITSEWNDISKMPEGSLKVKKIEDFNNMLSKRLPAPIWKQVLTAWKANMLTGIATHLVNIKTNAFNALLKSAESVPASAIDAMIGKFSGKRSVILSARKELEGFKGFGGSVGRTLKNFSEGFKSEEQASKWSKVKNGMKNVYGNFGQTREMEQIDFTKNVFPDTPIGRAFENYTDFIYKTLDSEDTPFFEFHKARSLYEQGLAYAKNNKIKSSAKWMNDFVKNPAAVVGEEEAASIMGRATADGLYGTFRSDTELNKIIQTAKQNKLFGPVAEFLIPFSKTPAAFGVQMLDYTPIGLGKTIFNAIKNGKKWTPEVQRAFVNGITRGTIGSAGIVAIGRKLYDKGLVTGGYPSDQKTRDEWKAQNKIPNAIKIGNAWVPVIQFGPAGLLLPAGADFQKSLIAIGSISEASTQGMIGLAKSLNEQTFLKGLNATLNAVTDPERSGKKWVQQTISSIVPSIMNDIAKSADDFQRSPDTIKDVLKARFPGLRNSTPKKLDAFGQPIQRMESRAEQIVGKGYGLAPRGTTERTTPYIAEMENLMKQDVDVRPSVIDNAPVKGLPFEPDQYYIYQRLYGNVLTSALNTLIQSNAYINMDLTHKEEAWKEVYDGVKTAAREELAPIIYAKQFNMPPNVNRNTLMEAIRAEVKYDSNFKNFPPERQELIIKKLMGIQ